MEFRYGTFVLRDEHNDEEPKEDLNVETYEEKTWHIWYYKNEDSRRPAGGVTH